jgi:hypothetical protein
MGAPRRGATGRGRGRGRSRSNHGRGGGKGRRGVCTSSTTCPRVSDTVDAAAAAPPLASDWRTTNHTEVALCMKRIVRGVIRNAEVERQVGTTLRRVVREVAKAGGESASSSAAAGRSDGAARRRGGGASAGAAPAAAAACAGRRRGSEPRRSKSDIEGGSAPPRKRRATGGAVGGVKKAMVSRFWAGVGALRARHPLAAAAGGADSGRRATNR